MKHIPLESAHWDGSNEPRIIKIQLLDPEKLKSQPFWNDLHNLISCVITARDSLHVMHLLHIVFETLLLFILYIAHIIFIIYFIHVLVILYILLVIVVAYLAHIIDIACYISNILKYIKIAMWTPSSISSLHTLSWIKYILNILK